MHAQKPYYHLRIAVLFLSLVLQNCGQPNQEFGNMEAYNANERLINTTDQVLSPPPHGPFITSSGALVTFQQKEGSWIARVQETGALVYEQHLDVGCAGDITKTLSKLQHQPADCIKPHIHVLSPVQSPTGKGVVYLGRLGLSGGMEQGEEANDTFTLPSIHQAAQEGNLAAVKYFVEEKEVDVNTRDDDGKTALHLAAIESHLAVIAYLVEKKANENARDNRRRTALHWAVLKEDLAVIKYLVEKGNADVNAQDDDGKTVLHWAARGENLAVLKYLVEKKVDVHARDDDGMTVLHWAAEGGHLAIIKYLVEEQVDVNARDRWGVTALHLAAIEGRLAVVKYFVEEKKADVHAQDDDGKTALHWAARGGHLTVIIYFVEEERADVNARDDDERTMLHWAAEKGHLAVVKYFMEEKKADVNARDDDGKTALHWAAQEGHLAVIKHLVKEKRANVSARDNQGATILHYAVEKSHLAVVKHLVEKKKADVNAQDSRGATTLHYAALKGDLPVLKYLVEAKNTDANVRDNQGMTALHWAVLKEDMAVIKYLAEEGEANVNVQDNRGMTALHWAAQGGQQEIVSYLMEEVKGGHNSQITESLEHSCFRQWENIRSYAQLITLADRLYSKEGSQTLRPEEISAITDASLKLKLTYKGQGHELSQECTHDLGTAFSNRFKNRIWREGVPKVILLDSEAYFKNILLPASLRTELQTLVAYINAGRELYILHASSLVALLEASEGISSTPLSFILCPPVHFRPYNPEDLVQRRTVEFYTQRSAKLARLVENAENVDRELSSKEIEKALCKYLLTYLSQLEPHGEIIKAVIEDGVRKDLAVNQIESMLIEDDVLLPIGFKEKLALLLEKLLTPSVP